MKLSSFVIGILLISIVVVGFSLLAVFGGQTYGKTYTNTSDGLNQYAKINGSINEMNIQLQNATESSGGFAIIGDYLGYGKRILFVSLTSFNMFTSMSDTAYQNVAYGTTSSAASGTISTIRYILLAIVLVVILFIIIAVLMGRNSL